MVKINIQKNFGFLFLLSALILSQINFSSEIKIIKTTDPKTLVFLGKLYDPNYAMGKTKNLDIAIQYYQMALKLGCIQAEECLKILNQQQLNSSSVCSSLSSSSSRSSAISSESCNITSDSDESEFVLVEKEEKKS